MSTPLPTQTNINVTDISITSENPAIAALTYSNSDGDATETGAATIVYTMALPTGSPNWTFVGISPASSSDITSQANGNTLTLTDSYNGTGPKETFSFVIQVSNGTKTYSSADPEIINKPKT